MTANSSRLQCLLWDDEAAFGDTVTSMSGAKKLTILEPIDTSGLTHEMMEPGRVVQYMNENTSGVPGVMGGSFSYSLYLCGHGSTTAGAITLSDLENQLGWVLGAAKSAPADGTAINGGASTATNLVVDASGTLAAGQLIRVGAKGDGGGDGQWAVVNAHSTNDVSLRTALPAAPADNAVVYTAANIHTLETPTNANSAISGYRYQIFTANQQFICHGCFPTAITFSLVNGQPPRVTITVGVSWWEYSADTFPETTSLTTHTPAPIAAGSFFLQTHGTTTRATYSVRQFELTVALNTVVNRGPDSTNAYQDIVGARRSPMDITCAITLDATAASTTPTYPTAWATNSPQHLLYSMSTANGQAMALYLSRLMWRGNKPTQMDMDGLNRQVLNFKASTNTVTTSELTLSALRIGFA